VMLLLAIHVTRHTSHITHHTSHVTRHAGFGMAYFDRSDLPFYYAMADAWTVGDQYFQSACY
jgi:phospholipase C